MRLFGAQHGNRGGQALVQSADDFSARAGGRVDAQVGHLRNGVHAGIGTAGALQFHSGAEVLFGGGA